MQNKHPKKEKNNLDHKKDILKKNNLVKYLLHQQLLYDHLNDIVDDRNLVK